MYYLTSIYDQEPLNLDVRVVRPDNDLDVHLHNVALQHFLVDGLGILVTNTLFSSEIFLFWLL